MWINDVLQRSHLLHNFDGHDDVITHADAALPISHMRASRPLRQHGTGGPMRLSALPFWSARIGESACPFL